MSEPSIIGWTEYIDFPDWGIRGLKAKIDTGARTSALHVENLTQHGHDWVTFDVMLHRRHHDRRQHIRTKLVKVARVRSSTGHFSERCFVTTRIRLGPVDKEVEFSLVSRQSMLFRVLLGRKALERDFWVDVSRRSLLTRRVGKTKSRGRPSPHH